MERLPVEWPPRCPPSRRTICRNPGATLVEYELAEDVFSAVLRGEADATLVDIGFAHEHMAKSGEGLAIVGPQVMLDAGTGIGVRESDGALKDKLDRAIGRHEAGRLVERPHREVVRP